MYVKGATSTPKLAAAAVPLDVLATRGASETMERARGEVEILSKEGSGDCAGLAPRKRKREKHEKERERERKRKRASNEKERERKRKRSSQKKEGEREREEKKKGK